MYMRVTCDSNEIQLGVIRRIQERCDAVGVMFWLFGGWGIDALTGGNRRRHHDIDLLTALADRGRFQDVVAPLVADVPEDTAHKLRFVACDVQCDTRFFQALPEGTLVLDLDANDPCVYPTPADSFPVTPNADLGFPCRAISWAAQYVAKAGYRYYKDEPLREKDREDLHTIGKHLSASQRKLLDALFPGIPKERYDHELRARPNGQGEPQRG